MANPATVTETVQAFPDRGTLAAIDPGKGATPAAQDDRVTLSDVRADQTGSAAFNTHTSIAWEPANRPVVPSGAIGQGTGVARDAQLAGSDPDASTPAGATGDAPSAAPTVSAGTPAATSVPITYGTVTGATGYDLQFKTSAASTWALKSSITASPYSLTGLTASTAYNVQVRAKNAVGSGPWSSTVNVTTAAS